MIRCTSKDDITTLVKMGEDFWDLTRYAAQGLPYCPQHTEEIFQTMRCHGISLVAEEEGQIIGYIMMAITPVMFSKGATMATEIVFYVDPDHRKKGLGSKLVGLDLIEAAEKVAKYHGCSFFNMVNLSEVMPEKSAKLYKHLGMELVESTYLKGI